MLTRKAILLVVSSSSLVAVFGMHAAPAAASQSCMLEKYRPSSVTPYVVEESAGYDMFSETKGAQLYIPAQNGLTRQWLQLTLEQAFVNESNASDAQACHLAVKPVKIVVTSAGDGFWIQLIGHDERDAKELIRWATRVVHEESAREAAKK